MPFSTYAANATYNAWLRNTGFTPPVTVYAALYTTDPTVADVGTEVTGTGYARVAVTFGAPSGGSGSDTAEVAFGTVGTTWGTIGWVGMRDAASGGNLILFGPLSAPVTPAIGEVPRFKVADLLAAVA